MRREQRGESPETGVREDRSEKRQERTDKREEKNEKKEERSVPFSLRGPPSRSDPRSAHEGKDEGRTGAGTCIYSTERGL